MKFLNWRINFRSSDKYALAISHYTSIPLIQHSEFLVMGQYQYLNLQANYILLYVCYIIIVQALSVKKELLKSQYTFTRLN